MTKSQHPHSSCHLKKRRMHWFKGVDYASQVGLPGIASGGSVYRSFQLSDRDVTFLNPKIGVEDFVTGQGMILKIISWISMPVKPYKVIAKDLPDFSDSLNPPRDVHTLKLKNFDRLSRCLKKRANVKWRRQVLRKSGQEWNRNCSWTWQRRWSFFPDHSRNYVNEHRALVVITAPPFPSYPSGKLCQCHSRDPYWTG